ncbi:MAG: polysaccharide deacetylase family protein [Clostridia bacterium]|nr:polysaccharide deacetylase family protein [Clostridia bacterium]
MGNILPAYIKFPDFKFKAVTLSYDDGVRQDKRLIAIMQKYGLKGTFNLNGGFFDKYGRMTKQESLELYPAAGMEVAVHGYSHMTLPMMETELAVNDILLDRKELENTFGRVIKGMAYANGWCSEEIIELLKKIGVDWARWGSSTEKFDLPDDWMRWQGTCHHDNPRLMELAKTFAEMQESWYFWARKLQVFYLWGHSYEFDDNKNWDVIERFAAYMGGRNDVWYATNGEIFEYLQAAQRLQFSADGGLVKNPTAMDIYIDYLGKRCVVKAGTTVKIENVVENA